MKRRNILIGLALSSVAALVVAFFIVDRPNPSEIVAKPELNETSTGQTSELPSAKPRTPSRTPGEQSTPPSLAHNTLDKDVRPEASDDDKGKSRKLVRERATKDIQKGYSLLLEHLPLPQGQREALTALLIELRIESTSTSYSTGREIGQQERLNRIAAVVGGAKLQEFLKLEKNLSAYYEVQNIDTLLEQNGMSLTPEQREAFLKVVITMADETENEQPAALSSERKRNQLETLKAQMSRKDEEQRRILELAPSVLSSKQVQLLFDQYEFRSAQRNEALQAQMKYKEKHPNEKVLIWTPAY